MIPCDFFCKGLYALVLKNAEV
ncbi:unnamed protein product [Cuscuta europaea]|uniref:Uncharacterized protein n=1 Tax=Cuscuta europaea TaxID=41803 RepID=A0A9P0VMW5_CUSEU|nr:unnamed protein product [Cuscuta europaea]